MTQTTQETQTVEQAEFRLWIEYVSELSNAEQAWRSCEEAWRNHAMTGLLNDATLAMWQQCRETHSLFRERAKVAFREWQRVAYPMNDIHLNDDDEEQSS